MSNVSFFGLNLTPGQEETIPIPAGIVLHLSQVTFATEGKDGVITRIFAVIEDDASDDESDEVNTSVQRDRKEFAIATLVGKSKESQNLELNFSEIDGDVCFKAVGGKTNVHLTGYYTQVASEDDLFGADEDDDHEFGEIPSDEDDEIDGELPPNFTSYETDSDDEDFKVNESALDENNDSGYVIQGESDEEDEDEAEEDAEEDIQASLELLKKQIAAQQKQQQNTAGQKRKNAPASNDESAAKKAKTAEQPKKQEAKKETPSKQPQQQQQQGKKNKNKKNKNKGKK